MQKGNYVFLERSNHWELEPLETIEGIMKLKLFFKGIEREKEFHKGTYLELIRKFKYWIELNDLKVGLSPGWCGSVDWVPACEPKSRRFDSRSEQMPGDMQVPSGGARKRQPHIDDSLPLFLRPFPSLKIINKIF